jgi:hypothetical protein
MSLLSCTKAILDRTESITGRPVLVREDPSLQVQAHIQIARGAAPMHVLRYKPATDGSTDYCICFQCGFLIRLFENPAEQRFDFAESPEARPRMESLLRDRSLPPGVSQLRDMLLNGLMTQLRSVPIGLRIDDWLFAEYPEIRLGQVAGVRTQLKQNTAALGPKLKRTFPRKVFNANGAMNAAFAVYWSGSLDDPTQTMPFRAAGLLAAGESLIRIFKEASAAASADRSLVDAWAKELGLEGWYRWIPYRLDE